MWLSFSLLLFGFLSFAKADTPANCSYESIRGTWVFHVGPGGFDNSLDCSDDFEVQQTVTVTLDYPDKVTDNDGNSGFWTMIYNQGFEVVVDGVKYFAFSNYTVVSKSVVLNHCDSTFNGWSHKVDGTDWACYYGEKSADTHRAEHVVQELDLSSLYVKNLKFINAINNSTKMWEAAHYPEMESMTLEGRLRRAGGLTLHGGQTFPPTAPVHPSTRLYTSRLPLSLDWRNAKGQDFVTPIRNQGQCGSCYAFASMAMLESRFLIAGNLSVQKIFSPQDVVSCSEYAQGCEGGFPYLIAGKYAEDFGVVEEDCYPYLGHDTKCEERPGCTRYRATKYEYVGGYFGNCNEEEIMMNLAQYGPVSVAFEVTSEFQMYRRGIFHTTGLTDSFNPWLPTNHAVLVVGYGEELGMKYWIVKNSWGPKWGENGYFRIIRGTNELNIESMAVSSLPVVN